MRNFYNLAVRLARIVPSVIFFTLSFVTAFSQKEPLMRKGVIRIKVVEALAIQLEQTSISRTTGGIVITGITSLDEFNRQYNVTQFHRVFRDAGKFETRHRKYGLHRWYELSTGFAIPLQDALIAYNSITGVERTEPVYAKAIVGYAGKYVGPVVVKTKPTSSTTSLDAPSNDPMLESQWHYNNTGQSGGSAGADIRLFDAWKKETGKQEVIVAVTDGGIQTDHPDLMANLWNNPGEIAGNNVDDDNNGFVDDVYGYSFEDDTGNIVADDHGTHVAGTVAAVTHNGIGVAGVAGGSGSGDGVRLMSCAVFNNISSDGFAESYVYAADNGAVISQNSWGYSYPGTYERVVLDAIDYFIAEAGKDENGDQTGPMKGGLVVFAAGNSNSQERYFPGYYAPTFSVASTTHRDLKAWYSNYGPWVDISAPGGETDTIEEEGVLSTLSGGRYGFYMGTSMAAPHVSGAAALVISRYGKDGFTPDAVRERLRFTSERIDEKNPPYSGKLGSGRLDASAALQDDDNTPPEAIDDLSITDSDIGSETLSWTVPTDPLGFVVSYDIRYSTSPITEANFSAATPVSNPPPSLPAGETQTFTIANLSGGILYYFAVKSVDFNDNVSAISNVIAKTSQLTPVIQLAPSALTENLQTAQTTTGTFTVNNTGMGPLKFRVANASMENDFASCSPAQGNLAPGASQVITVAFDAHNLLEGTYRKDLRIESNDPERNVVIVPLTLVVTNNDAPIASVAPASLDFKSVQVGTSSGRIITVHNAGSDPLVINAVTSDNSDFATDLQATMRIDPFSDGKITVTFSPSTLGLKNGTISIHTNDAANAVLMVPVNGEGLDQPPVVAMPASIEETLNPGTTSTRTLVLTNNGSFDRAFHIDVVNKGLQINTLKKDTNNTIIAAGAAEEKKSRAKPAPDPAAVNDLLKSYHHPRKIKEVQKGRAGRNKATATLGFQGNERYSTDFENFSIGSVHDQEGWYSEEDEGWRVEVFNPKGGEKHLRGAFVNPGQTTLAISPLLFEEQPEESILTTMVMKVNLDHSEGTTWEIIPQDHWGYVATRIKIHPDKAIEVMSLNEDYDILWSRIDIEIPSGYFDLAVEHNGFGDGSSGFSVFDVYIDNRKIFTGYGIGGAINELAFLSTADNAGPVLDVDDVEYYVGEYIPSHIQATPVSGILPGGGSMEIALDIDGTSLKYGTYSSDIIARIDETDEVVVPATVTIAGAGSLKISTNSLYAISFYRDEVVMMDIMLSNTGGTPVDYQALFDFPQLRATPLSGTIPMRGVANISFELDPEEISPGIYYDTIKIVTTLEELPVIYISLVVTICEPLGRFSSPLRVKMELQQGEVGTTTFQISNTGQNSIAFEPGAYDHSNVSIDPKKGLLVSNQPQDITITLDARTLQEGVGFRQMYFRTNDPSRIFQPLWLDYNILPNSGRITREEWTGVTGKKVTDIPVNTPPSGVTEIPNLEGPYRYADNYGARIRGYILAPYTGSYTFWITSDDQSELWLSSGQDPTNKVKIAYLTSSAARGQYDKYPSQKSSGVYLEEGNKYYIEVLHKEGPGVDHVSVGWEIPFGIREFPIPGARLFPFNPGENKKPVISITSPMDGESFISPATVEINADAFDSDGKIIKVEFYNGTTKLNVDAIAPYTFRWENEGAGSFRLMAIAFDNYGATDSATVNIVIEDEACAATGSVKREVWTGISGSLVSFIPVKSPPSFTDELLTFESPYNMGDNYGSRISGYLCVNSSGNYTFFIASDGHSELWLSTDEDPVNKVKMAYVTGYTLPRQWEKYPTQRSLAVALQAGHNYYIEALHKEASGSDHLSVGWQLPDGTMERPIPGNRLFANLNTSVSARAEHHIISGEADKEVGSNGISLFPNPATQGMITLTSRDYADKQSTDEARIEISSVTGTVVYAEVFRCNGECSNITIDIDSKFPPGVYVVNAIINGTRFSKRLVIY